MKVTNVMMHIVIVCALLSIGLNVYQEKGLNSVLWQLTTLIWVFIAKMYKNEAENYKN
jgi:hypothetical protein